MFYMHIHYKMITTIKQINIDNVVQLGCFFFFGGGSCGKIYSESKFQVDFTLLLAIVTMLYMKSPEFIHLKTESLYPLTKNSPSAWTPNS